MAEPKERPILFSAPMVRAILDGQKTQTRRVVKPQPKIDANGNFIVGKWNYGQHIDGAPCTRNFVKSRCPYGRPGDRLWVRETWTEHERHSDVSRIVYAASRDQSWSEMHRDVPVAQAVTKYAPRPMQLGWRPSIHMPRWASRILLEIVSVRVERLNDCTASDARAEGIFQEHHVWRDCEYPLADVAYRGWPGAPVRFSDSVDAYRDLWEHINGAGSWSANPWVWVVEFNRIDAKPARGAE